MRITCTIEVANRLLPSFNMKSKNKASKAQVSIGRKPGADLDGGEVLLMIITKQNLNGAKYKLKDNVEQIFGRFIQEGKATVRMRQPPHDLCLSQADPVQLKGFLSVMRMALQGKGLDKVTLTPLAPGSTKTSEKLKTRLSVTCKRDYPITTNFPKELKFLSVHNCNLKRFDNRMLQLRQLQVLNLNQNVIQSIPDNIDALSQLSELHLSENGLVNITRKFCLGKLCQTLCFLDLSNNQLKALPECFPELKSLVTLKLDNNELQSLPVQFGRLSQLRMLTAQNNKLSVLPATFPRLHLDQLDLFGNPLTCGPNVCQKKPDYELRLLELAARAIIKHRVPYTEEDVGHLIGYLNSARICLCGQIFVTWYGKFMSKFDLKRVAASVTAINQTGQFHVYVQGYLCSAQCFNSFNSQPDSSYWESSRW